MCFDQVFLKTVLPEAVIVAGNFPENGSFGVDSRTLDKNQIFVAIQGSQVDGHQFIEDALSKGAGVIAALKHRSSLESLVAKYGNSKFVVLVEDPLQALYALARAWRLQITAPVVGITGSVGKTTTKEYAAFILKQDGQNCFASEGNQNTLLGIALNLLKMRKEHAVGLFEVGLQLRGEMVKLVDLLRPTTAVITCIGHSHMQGLGSLVTIAAEKRAVFAFFTERNIGMINGDQSVLADVGYPHPVIRFGQKTTNQIQARKIKTADGKITFILKLYHKKYTIELNHTHQGMVNNILAATAIAYQCGVKDEVIVAAIHHLPTYNQRFEVCALKDKKGIIIDDCYNASPESVKAALLAFENMKGVGKKIAVLGDMLELGEESHFWHRQVGRFLKKSRSVNHLVLVGGAMKAVKETAPYGMPIEMFESWQDALERLQSLIQDDSAVLVKGSRGMQLEHIVKAFAHKEKNI